MADLVFVLLLGALFALTAGFVRVCDRMLGADELSDATPVEPGREVEQVAA